MPGLTTKEASRIEDGLHLEEMLVAKFDAYSKQTTDPECRRILADVANRHRHHCDVLRRHVPGAPSAVGSAGETSPGSTPGGGSSSDQERTGGTPPTLMTGR